jgi:hypothetical protein
MSIRRERRYCSPLSYVAGLSLRRLRRSVSERATGAVACAWAARRWRVAVYSARNMSSVAVTSTSGCQALRMRCFPRGSVSTAGPKGQQEGQGVEGAKAAHSDDHA